MDTEVALIGFGEAGQTFAEAGNWRRRARVFDLKTTDDATAPAMIAHYREADVTGCVTLDEALSHAATVLSLVTADQALAVAEAAALQLEPNALYFDMNSVAPATKAKAAKIITAAGAHYVDAAIMAPVNPAKLQVPLLLSGAHAKQGAQALGMLGFTNVTDVGDEVGRASAIKMIRSVMIKGIEALTAECLIAAHAAGVTDEVLSSLGDDWATRADYNLNRMLIHGCRRAAEMQEVADTLLALGVDPKLTRGTVARQRALGSLGGTAPDGLDAKLDLIARSYKEVTE